MNQRTIFKRLDKVGYEDIRKDGAVIKEAGKNRLAIVDGSYYLHMSYHAFKDKKLTNKAGQDITLVYGFISMLGTDLQEFNPTHIFVTFDGANNTKERTAIYAEYKANKPDSLFGQDPSFLQQIAWIQELLTAYGLFTIVYPGVEADDVLASVITQFESVAKILVFSRDKDLMQLVKKGVRLWDRRSRTMFDNKRVIERYKVRPDQMLDLLSLIGDAADNIPGCPKIAAGRASEILKEFDTVDEYITKQQTLEKSSKTDLINKYWKYVKPWYLEGGLELARSLITLRTRELFVKKKPLTLEQLLPTKPQPEAVKELLNYAGIKHVPLWFDNKVTTNRTKSMFRVRN